MDFLLLIIGFIFLVKGANLLVGSASDLAKILGVPAFIVGLSVVAFGTSAPEAAIGIFSGIKHANQITLGDVIGSSIINIALVIGLTAVILPLKVEKTVILKEIPFSLAIQVLLFVMILADNVISRIDGAILSVVFLLFLYYIGVKSRQLYTAEGNPPNSRDFVNVSKRKAKILKIVALLLAGLVGMVAGGNLVLESSVSIAHQLGLSETLIGLTIVALGTSLPELVTCVIAALKKEDGIAVGNIIGSNIFNIVFVLGISSLIYPIQASGVGIDIAFMITTTGILFTMAYLKKSITRIAGTSLILVYLIYIVSKIMMM